MGLVAILKRGAGSCVRVRESFVTTHTMGDSQVTRQSVTDDRRRTIYIQLAIRPTGALCLRIYQDRWLAGATAAGSQHQLSSRRYPSCPAPRHPGMPWVLCSSHRRHPRHKGWRFTRPGACLYVFCDDRLVSRRLARFPAAQVCHRGLTCPPPPRRQALRLYATQKRL